jgi:hypothetical protein
MEMDPTRIAATVKAKIGEVAWRRLHARLAEVNGHIISRGIQSYQGKSDLLTGYSCGEFFDWDLYFENVYMSYYGISRYCRTNLEVFLDQQLECGFVARTLAQPRLRQHFKPFLAQIALLGSRQFDSFEWLRSKYYARLVKYLDYWFWFCDFDRNGLSVWDSADHSGMDNQDSRAGRMHAMTMEGADLNAYLVRELQAMAILAERLGYRQDCETFREHAGRLGRLVNDLLWHDEDGFYYDRNERTGQPVKVKSVAGFMPLWAGIVPAERAERIIRRHLINPDEFWLAYPIAGYARTEPDYYQERYGGECNWRGATWVPTNYAVFHGLMRLGYTDIAEQLAYRTFEMVLREETTREYYNAETGSGQGLNPFWGWSALAYFMPLEFEMNYDPTDLETRSILPLASAALGLDFAGGR